MIVDTEKYRKKRAQLIDTLLQELVPGSDVYPPEVYEAMRYSLFAGGKRLRPILLMAAADSCGVDGMKFLHVACGLEMIHTGCLIHDDLPEMDNDFFRRGKPTNHRVFGNGMALLAGTALITTGIEAILNQPDVNPELHLSISRELIHAVGPNGLIGGQTVDVVYRDKEIDEKSMQFLHKTKKGAIFKAAIRAGATLAYAKKRYIEALTDYAEHYGNAFQITDDILDLTGTVEKTGKSIGSDIRTKHYTYVSVYGLENAKQMACYEVDRALEALHQFGKEADVLRSLAKVLIVRDF